MKKEINNRIWKWKEKEKMKRILIIIKLMMKQNKNKTLMETGREGEYKYLQKTKETTLNISEK